MPALFGAHIVSERYCAAITFSCCSDQCHFDVLDAQLGKWLDFVAIPRNSIALPSFSVVAPTSVFETCWMLNGGSDWIRLPSLGTLLRCHQIARLFDQRHQGVLDVRRSILLGYYLLI